MSDRTTKAELNAELDEVNETLRSVRYGYRKLLTESKSADVKLDHIASICKAYEDMSSMMKRHRINDDLLLLNMAETLINEVRNLIELNK